jgi:hypothetical protein
MNAIIAKTGVNGSESSPQNELPDADEVEDAQEDPDRRVFEYSV